MPTGEFNHVLKLYFGAVDGAYTSMTAAEVKKGTYNVKAKIRDLLIWMLSEPVVRAYNSYNNLATFKGCDKIDEFYGKTYQLVCKFSKALPRKEMSIYFSIDKGIPPARLVAGNIWFIYFKENDLTPWLGILTAAEWTAIQNSTDINDFFQNEAENEESDKALQYKFDVAIVNITETSPPSGSIPLSDQTRKPIVSSSKFKKKLQNRNIKGAKGEEIVVELERRKLVDAGRADLAEQIEWKSKTEDGYGYDIESYEISPNGLGKKIFIEVKTTSGNINTPFNIGKNEVETSKSLGDSFYIYRVYNLDELGRNIKYYKVQGSAEDNFTLIPVDYKATVKSRKSEIH